MILAWMAAPCPPGNTMVFQWVLKYSILFSNTSNLSPGAQFTSIGGVDVDPVQGDVYTLSADGATYSFKGHSTAIKGTPGTVGAQTDCSVKNNQVSLALGIIGIPVFACDTQTNSVVAFTPKPKYYLAFGQYQQGTVLNEASMSHSIELNFEAMKTYSFTADIDASHNWNLSL